MEDDKRASRAIPSDALSLGQLKSARSRSASFVKGYQARDAILEVGRLIREHRQEADLSQAALAELSGLTQSEISRLENGSGPRGPGVEILDRVAAALGMRLDVRMAPLSGSVGDDEEGLKKRAVYAERPFA